MYDDDRRFRLLVHAKGFVPKQIDFKPGTAASPARVNVALQIGHILRGRVMLSDGRPARNVAVLYGGGEGIWSAGVSATTDAEGRFLFDSLPRTCVVSVSGPRGYADFESERLSLDQTTEINITLDKAALIKGRVVDDASGKPAIPFRIRVMASTNRQRDEPWPALEVRLAEEGQLIFQPQGRFEFDDLPPRAPLHLVVSAKGYADESLERVLALPDGQFKPLEIHLRKLDPRDLRTVSGSLLSAAGKPVAGAEVRLWTATSKPADLTRYPYNWTTIEDGYIAQTANCRQFLAGVTGKDGAFVFPDVPVAGYSELAYWGKGIAAGRETIPLTKDSGPSVPLTLHAAASARIVVEVDRKAWPDAGQIQIHGEKTGLFGDRSNHLAGDPPRLAFNDLPACRVRVQLCDGGQSFGGGTQFRVLSSQTVTLKAGETTTVRFDKP